MKKPNKSSKDSKNNLQENVSGFNDSKRSSKFDDLFGSSGRPNNPNGSSLTTKEKIKRIWKWVSISIYLFLAGLGVTGFIQSCVLQTNSTVGAGVELYNSSSEVAPYVSIFKIETRKKTVIKYDEKGNPIIGADGKPETEEIEYKVLVSKEKENYLSSKETIKTLKEQIRKIYGDEAASLYGAYDNHSSAIRIIGEDNLPINPQAINYSGSQEAPELITGDNGENNFVFMNNKILNYLNENALSYKQQNQLQEINYFVVQRPTGDTWNSLSDSNKNYYGQGLTDLSNAFQAFEEINGQWIKVDTINGQYVTKDVNADGFIDSEEYVTITDSNRIAKFKYSLNAEVATLSNNTDGLLNSEKYAYDYLQSMMNVLITFPQFQDFYQLVTKTQDPLPSSPPQIFSAFSRSNLQALTQDRVITRSTGLDQRAFDQNKLFTLEQKNAILTYQNEITSMMTKLGFGVRPQNYSDENSDFYEPIQTTDFKIELQPNVNNKKNLVLGTSSVAQKPISSWGNSWRLGPFYGLIVYPLSSIINGMMGSMPEMAGWDGVIAIVLAILLTRVIVTLFTYKSLFSSHKQQQLNPKKAKIDAKYEPFKGNKEMEQRKRVELQKLYKSNNVSMSAPLKAMAISMPIFFAVWRVVQGIPDIKATTWLGIQFSLTSWRELFAGAWQYLPLLVMAAGIQLLSQLLPRILNKKRMDERANRAEKAALKKSNKTQNIMMIVFVVMSVIFEAGVQIYWIVGGLWQIAQTLVVHHIVKSEWYRTKGYKYT